MDNWLAGKTYGQPHSRLALGYFRSKQTEDKPPQSLSLNPQGEARGSGPSELEAAQPGRQQHGHMVFEAFAFPPNDLPPFKFQVLHPQAQAFH